MAGLTWFELDVDFHEDPKIKALVSRLRQPLADSYVSRLYAYCYKHAVDRFPPESAPDTIEDIARWKGRRSVLFDALFAVEVLERDGGKVVVHGVAARLGPHLAKKQTDAERQKRHREKVAASIGRARDVTPPVTRDVTPDVTRESRGNKDKDKDKDPNQEAGSLAPRPVSPLVAFLRETYPDVSDPWACEASWSAAYPRVDLLAEAIRARAWEVSNPKNAKSHHARFLNAWFGRVKLPPVAPEPLPLPSLDAAWLGTLPPEKRARAEERWAATVERLKRAAYPDALPRLLAAEAASFADGFELMEDFA